jgi:hypothetical protein
MKRGAFKKPMQAHLAGLPESFRFSTWLRALRRAGNHEAVAEFEKDQRECGSNCPTHGPLTDPAIAIMPNKQVAFICPWCSSPDILAAWQKEGMRS